MFGCRAWSDSFYVTDSTRTAIEPWESFYLELYPNPSKGHFYIRADWEMGTVYRFSLLNINGQEVWKEKRRVQQSLVEIQIQEPLNGMYFLRIENEPGFLIEVEKVMIQQ